MTEELETDVPTPQFYQKVVALSDQGHSDWRVKANNNYGFTSATNAVLITAVEFALVASEYPIVFIQQGDVFRPVVILGLKEGQNLYLDDDKAWQSKYIPAYIRRYPFILAGDASVQDPTYTVCIDESFTGFNKKEGEALFEKDGSKSPYLERAITFLKDYQSQGIATEAFCKTVKKLDILEPMQANIASAKGEEFSVAGFWVVSRDKLKEKKPLELAELVKSDEMALIYAHLASLANFNQLVQRYSA